MKGIGIGKSECMAHPVSTHITNITSVLYQDVSVVSIHAKLLLHYFLQTRTFMSTQKSSPKSSL